jgi:hypothetical protein
MIEKETAAFVARGLFHVFAALARQPGDVYLAETKRQAQSAGQLLHEAGILARLFATQLMIQMEHAETQVPAGSELEQNVQQAHGIRAAGDRHAHALARLEHAITGDDFRNALEHEPILTS